MHRASASHRFVRRAYILHAPDDQPLERQQELQQNGALEELLISQPSVIRSNHRAYPHILAVSHRWEEKDNPDVRGLQLRQIQAYLKANPEVTHVWYE